MVPVIAIVGKSGSGKTVIMEKLIAEFKARGYRVGAIKHAHQTVELDAPGKDTWRYSQAGSDATVVSSPSRITIFKSLDREPTLEESALLLGEGYDLILAEGFKKSRVPKIEVCATGSAEEMVCTQAELAAVISGGELPLKIPRFGREQVKEIADFIEKELLAKMPADMAVTVNGKPVFLKRFVKDIIASSILAMLSTLKSVGLIRTAQVSIRTNINAGPKTERDAGAPEGTPLRKDRLPRPAGSQ
jgi:molybdopterin-guanine dinucleotide biosynthesis protein B